MRQSETHISPHNTAPLDKNNGCLLHNRADLGNPGSSHISNLLSLLLIESVGLSSRLSVAVKVPGIFKLVRGKRIFLQHVIVNLLSQTVGFWTWTAFDLSGY